MLNPMLKTAIAGIGATEFSKDSGFGGQLGEAYIHGMNGIAEAVRQVRGTAVNQVPGDAPVLVTAGTGVPTSGLILSPPGT
jgi:hypothetical protein